MRRAAVERIGVQPRLLGGLGVSGSDFIDELLEALSKQGPIATPPSHQTWPLEHSAEAGHSAVPKIRIDVPSLIVVMEPLVVVQNPEQHEVKPHAILRIERIEIQAAGKQNLRNLRFYPDLHEVIRRRSGTRFVDRVSDRPGILSNLERQVSECHDYADTTYQIAEIAECFEVQRDCPCLTDRRSAAGRDRPGSTEPEKVDARTVPRTVAPRYSTSGSAVCWAVARDELSTEINSDGAALRLS